MAARKKTTRRKKVEPGSRGLAAGEMAGGEPPAALRALVARVEAAGGRALAPYRDPLGGQWLLLAALPLPAVAPTPFQRDLSDAHVKRLTDVIERVGSFLDPLIAVPSPDADADADDAGAVRFWSPNGYHRLTALQRLGARAVTALISPDPALAYRILALNTEKAHNTKERALEAVRMAQGLAELDPRRPESDFVLELEDGALVTLGLAYQERPRFAGGAWAPALRASDAFLQAPIREALAQRRGRAQRLLALDDRVAEIMQGLKERGFDSPYLRNFVVARLRPFRARGKPAPDAEGLLAHLEQAAAGFDVGRVREDQIARTAPAAE